MYCPVRRVRIRLRQRTAVVGDYLEHRIEKLTRFMTKSKRLSPFTSHKPSQ